MGFVFGTSYITIFAVPLAALPTIAGAAVGLVVTEAVVRRGSAVALHFAANFVTAIFWVVLTLISVITAPAAPLAIVPWLVAVPLFAAHLCGLRAVLVWAGIALGTIFVIDVAGPPSWAYATVSHPLFWEGSGIMMLVVTVAALGFTARQSVDTLLGRLDALRRLQEDRNEQLEHTVEYQRRHDALTGLPNRQQFGMSGDAWLATETGSRRCDLAVVAVNAVDLVGLNASTGHEFGDAVVREIARRLVKASTEVAQCEMVARTSDDEFMLLVATDAGGEALRENVASVVDAVWHQFETPLTLDRERRGVALRAGWSMAGESDGMHEVMRDAEAALLRARASGWNVVEEFTPAVASASRRRARIERNFAAGLERGEFHLEYQPKVNIATGLIYGLEALVRWTHPAFGEISPVEFVPVAESSGFITDLGKWVLREACLQARIWGEADRRRDTKPLTVAINISTLQLDHPEFYDTVREVLLETGVDPHIIQLEVTETGLIRDPGAASAGLGRLRELGLTIALDDFGTGYSSLSYLAELPVDCIKLDKAFVDRVPGNNDAERITRIVLSLGVAKGVEVVAEGVETVEQHRYLLDAGCPFAQGWLYGKPMDPVTAHDWCDRHRHVPVIETAAGRRQSERAPCPVGVAEFPDASGTQVAVFRWDAS